MNAMEFVLFYILQFTIQAVILIAVGYWVRRYLKLYLKDVGSSLAQRNSGAVAYAVKKLGMPSGVAVAVKAMPYHDQWALVFRWGLRKCTLAIANSKAGRFVVFCRRAIHWLSKGFNIYILLALSAAMVKVVVWAYRRVRRQRVLNAAASLLRQHGGDLTKVPTDEYAVLKQAFAAEDIKHPALNPAGSWNPPEWVNKLFVDQVEARAAIRPWWEMYFEFVSMLTVVVTAVAALSSGPSYKLLSLVVKKLSAVHTLKQWLTTWSDWLLGDSDTPMPPTKPAKTKPPQKQDSRVPVDSDDEDEIPLERRSRSSSDKKSESPDEEDDLIPPGLDDDGPGLEFWQFVSSYGAGKDGLGLEYPLWQEFFHSADPFELSLNKHWFDYMLDRKPSLRKLSRAQLVEIAKILITECEDAGQADERIAEYFAEYLGEEFTVDKKQANSPGFFTIFFVSIAMSVAFWFAIYIATYLILRALEYFNGPLERKYRVVARGSPAYEELVKRYPLADFQIRDANGYVEDVVTFDVTEAKGGMKRRKHKAVFFDDDDDSDQSRRNRDSRVERVKIPQSDYQDFINFVQDALRRAKGDDQLVAAIKARQKSGIVDALDAGDLTELDEARDAIELLILKAQRKSGQKKSGGGAAVVEAKLDKLELNQAPPQTPQKPAAPVRAGSDTKSNAPEAPAAVLKPVQSAESPQKPKESAANQQPPQNASRRAKRKAKQAAAVQSDQGDKAESFNPRNPPLPADMATVQSAGVFVVTQAATGAMAHGVLIGTRFFVPRHVLDEFKTGGEKLTMRLGLTIPGRADVELPISAFTVAGDNVDHAYIEVHKFARAFTSDGYGIPASASVRPWNDKAQAVGIIWHTSAVSEADRKKYNLPLSAWVASTSHWMRGVAGSDDQLAKLAKHDLVGVVHYNTTYCGVSGAPLMAYLDNRWVVTGYHIGTAARHDGQYGHCFRSDRAYLGTGVQHQRPQGN